MKESNYNIYIAAENFESEINSESITKLIKSIFSLKQNTFKKVGILIKDDEFENEEIEKIERQKFLNRIKKETDTNNSILAIPVNKGNLHLINQEDSWLVNLFRSSNLPILTFKKLPTTDLKNLIAAIDLEIDFMPFILKLLKLTQSMKNVELHIVSALKNTNHFNINKATQQLSFLNELFTESKIKFTAEIVYSQSEEVSKFKIVLDHIKRVDADIVLINKNSFSNNNHIGKKENLFELLSKSDIPIITFV